MALKLFDTATRTLRPFVPLNPNRVSIYLCGATVQSGPHIGHLRSAVVFDQLRRWLEGGHGYEVTFIRNVTDLDDKVLAASREAHRPWWALAATNARAFNRTFDAVAVRPPTHEPWATSHIAEMLTFIERLVERGHAYRATDGSANVYFDVASWPDYGALTMQDPHNARVDIAAVRAGKRDPRDFALWKATDGLPDGTFGSASAAWPSPFGAGRPGWHLSCSTMIHRYLGEELDIHAGGLDLRFPHHENEQAQSRAAGYGFTRYWMHNGLVTVAGDKMGKSLGNSVQAEDLLRQVRPVELRYYLASAHYRSNVDFDRSALTAAASAVGRIEGFLHRAQTFAGVTALLGHGDGQLRARVPEGFHNAMNDDLNVPAALAVIHETVREGNAALNRADTLAVGSALTSVTTMTNILGINPTDPTWSERAGGGNDSERTLHNLVAAALAEREGARSRGDFVRSDQIRDQLYAAGIVLSDTSGGSEWHIESRSGASVAAWGDDENDTAQEPHR